MTDQHTKNTDGDWPEDSLLENGNYQCRCFKCERIFIGYKRRVYCKACVVNEWNQSLSPDTGA